MSGGNGARIHDSPASNAFPITPADNVVFPSTRGVYVGGTGTLVVLFDQDAAPVTLASVPAGALLPICIRCVQSTGTTATNIVGIY